MREILLATAIGGAIVLFQLAVRVLASPTWLGIGLTAIVAGLIVSVPSAIVYHLRLHAALARRDALERGWIWHPTRLHGRLPEEERFSVLVWFVVGVLGWSLALLGCALVAAVVWGLRG